MASFPRTLDQIAEYNMQFCMGKDLSNDPAMGGVPGAGIPTPNDAQRIAGIPLPYEVMPSPTKRYAPSTAALAQNPVHPMPMTYAYGGMQPYHNGMSMYEAPEHAAMQHAWPDERDAGAHAPYMGSVSASPSRMLWSRSH